MQISDNLETTNEDWKTKYTYLLAEFENYKKRVAIDNINNTRATLISAISPFLNINDYLQMAKDACEKSDNIDSLKSGINMIVDLFSKTLEDHHIEKIKTKNEKFDHNFHNAIEYKTSDDVPEGFIITETKPGYLYGNVVINPSNVIVSSGKE